MGTWGEESRRNSLSNTLLVRHVPLCLLLLAGGSGGSPGPQPLALIAANKEPLVLTIASFAVTKLAYVRLTKMFREQYLSEKGIDVRFRLTFAGSGVQVRSLCSRPRLLGLSLQCVGLISCVDGCHLVLLSSHEYRYMMPRADTSFREHSAFNNCTTRPIALHSACDPPRSVFS